MKRNGVFGKMFVFGIISALAVLAMAAPALAQMSQEMQDAHKMMSDGWKMYNEGQGMVIKGKEMNDLVAVNMGFQNEMAPGDRYIQDGRNTFTQAATLFGKGEKTFVDNMNTPSVAKQGLKMMSDGFKMADGGSKMVEQGMTMNIKVAEAKGAIEKFAQGNQVINDGRATMQQGAQLFMQGEAIFLKMP